ncbi:DNA transposase THAP9-like 1 [Homarus americanus]|uniref:DNA transposase THAP9-like 1 n=1 Tax=Homarus americanus TaxID=6706 RepID=A0A8J5NC81_HOMAM|nr:DNA transposase THAP9-like 1 [Homarus americanus]
MDLVKKQIAKNSGKPVHAQYAPALRSFALTLNFYSPQANKFIRKTFDTCLPHPRTLEKWYSAVEVKPGFTEASFSALKQVKKSTDETSGNIFSLVMDEMAVRQHVEWDDIIYHGLIDIGTELDDDCLPVAKKALTQVYF